MAYYAYNAGHPAPQPISGLGSYYAWGSTADLYRPINGLASTEDQKLADEAARERIERRPPLAIVGEWAEQVTDISWREVRGASMLTLIPLVDADVPAVKQAAFGNELPAVAVYGKHEASRDEAYRAFLGTPYVLVAAMSVYSLADRGAVADARYLWIAVPRSPSDKEGGSGSLELAAKKLHGSLCYLVSLPKPNGARGPGAPFMAARDREMNGLGEFLMSTQSSTAASTASQPVAPADPVEAAVARPEVKHAGLVLGGMAVAGAVWYFLSRRGS
jgi:hypothetical protein